MQHGIEKQCHVIGSASVPKKGAMLDSSSFICQDIISLIPLPLLRLLHHHPNHLHHVVIIQNVQVPFVPVLYLEVDQMG